MLFKIPKQKSINEHIYTILDRASITAIIDEYKSYTRPFTEEEIRDYFASIDTNWRNVFELLKQRHVQGLQLTPVGVYIGIRQLSKICGEPIPMELFFQ